jgi:uncharacterized protein with NRDE domain
MCIVIVTTSHPDYALIVIDNRDEFILRPTSRPHWWSHKNGRTEVLSSRDLQRPEKGTWLGITKEGLFAVLTNYRETDAANISHPVHGTRSRGGMVTAWLGSDVQESAEESVHRMIKDGGCKGVGGFSMLCGKLKLQLSADGSRNIEPIAIISNRKDHVGQVPWIGGSRGEVHGLSNTAFDDPREWAKIVAGKRLTQQAVEMAVRDGLDEEGLAEKLFEVLDTDSLPRHEGMSLLDYVQELKLSIFIPPIGDESHREAMAAAVAKGKGVWATDDQKAAEEELLAEERPDALEALKLLGFETGMYGTQRQTVLMVDWEGNATCRERALWDGNGNLLPKGEGDMTFRFKIDGWETPR